MRVAGLELRSPWKVRKAEEREVAAPRAKRRKGAFRATFRLAGIVLFLLALMALITLVAPLSLLARLPGDRARNAFTLLRCRVLRRSAQTVLALLGVRVRVHGEPPRAPFVLVSNHLSYLDIVVLASVAPGTFVAKAEVRGWPLLGPIVGAFGTVFLDRDRKLDLPRALAAMENTWEDGQGLVLFPEGTTSDGSEILPFRSPLLAFPARHGLPVHAAALRYAPAPGEPPAAESVCWWGDGELAPHLFRLATLTGVEATLDFHPEPVADHDRKALAARLEERVREMCTPARRVRSRPRPISWAIAGTRK